MPSPLIRREGWLKNVTYVFTEWTTGSSLHAQTMSAPGIASISEILMPFKGKLRKNTTADQKNPLQPQRLEAGSAGNIPGIDRNNIQKAAKGSDGKAG